MVRAPILSLPLRLWCKTACPARTSARITAASGCSAAAGAGDCVPCPPFGLWGSAAPAGPTWQDAATSIARKMRRAARAEFESVGVLSLIAMGRVIRLGDTLTCSQQAGSFFFYRPELHGVTRWIAADDTAVAAVLWPDQGSRFRIRHRPALAASGWPGDDAPLKTWVRAALSTPWTARAEAFHPNLLWPHSHRLVAEDGPTAPTPQRDCPFESTSNDL